MSSSTPLIVAPSPEVIAKLQPDQARFLLAHLYELQARKLAASLARFVRAGWAVLEPERPLLWNWHYDVMCEHLVAASLGIERKIIFNVPPRMGKSRFIAVLWAVWNWVRAAHTKWIFLSYSEDLTLQHSRERRDLMESDWFLNRFAGRVTLAGDQNVKTWYDNTARGSMFSSSVGGTVTGKGGDFIVIDDPHDPRRALSDAERRSALTFVDQVMSTRLDDPKTGVQVVIMQRLHEEDLTGHLLKQGGWTLVRFPMESEGVRNEATGEVEPERVEYPLSKRVRVRAIGELLHDARFGKPEIDDLKIRLGSYGAAAQLQQRPSPLEGGMLKRAWFRRYALEPVAMAARCKPIILSWDMAFKETTDTDFVVGQVWGRERPDAPELVDDDAPKRGANIFLLDQVRDRMDFPNTVRAFRDQAAKWEAIVAGFSKGNEDDDGMAIAKLVEAKANGPAVLSQLKNEIIGLLPIEVKDSKVARVSAYSPAIEAGNVWLPAGEHAPYIGEFIEECAIFPRGANDDQVDAMTQALGRLIGKREFDIEAWARAVERKAKGLPPEGENG